ncbi:MAG: tRNA epoxyqueuosine(34) reductase QueG [bacterium JZ-2024 1]
MTPEQRSAIIKSLADKAGFDAVGITDNAPLSGFERFRRWISRGFHGEMKYLEHHMDRRQDVRNLAPFTRSVIVVLQNYRPEGPFEVDPASAGAGVARYARGKDYHITLVERLRAFVRAMQQELGETFEARVYTDTGAILERELAVRAGLGWIGKSTLLIAPRLGTYTLIGLVLTSLELAPDRPFVSDHCGKCRACIEACPTHAIHEGRWLDARACISYWTIENRGRVPPQYQHVKTNWWFGCDICQDVCPWNRWAPATIAPEFAPIPVLRFQKPSDLLEMMEGAYREAFRHSPVRRPKFDGFRRNLLRIVAEQRSGRALQPAEGTPQIPTRSWNQWILI